MARLEWSREAVRSLDRLIQTHSLPPDTKERVKHTVQPLQRFPLLGPALPGRDDVRFIVGPWRWLIVLYVYFEEDDRVVILLLEDARASTAVAPET